MYIIKLVYAFDTTSRDRFDRSMIGWSVGWLVVFKTIYIWRIGVLSSYCGGSVIVFCVELFVLAN